MIKLLLSTFIFVIVSFGYINVSNQLDRVIINQELIYEEEVKQTDLIQNKVSYEKDLILETNDFSLIYTSEKVEYEEIDLFCMAKNIYHEARGEDSIGKYAVAQVTLNRLKSKKYPNTICKVVMDNYQFSWANNRKIRWTHPKGVQWEEAKIIAEDVIINGTRVKGLTEALYYHADYVKPHWKEPEAKIVKLGTHIFYSYAKQAE